MPRLTRIYTRTGDDGSTALGSGTRVAKDNLRVDCYGTVDELNSQLGVALSQLPPESLAAPLARIQNDLFHLGADLCVTEADKAARPAAAHRGAARRVGRGADRRLERAAAGARELHPAGWEFHRRATACRPHGLPASGADSGRAGAAGAGRRLGAALSQPALRPALRLRASRQSPERGTGPAVGLARLSGAEVPGPDS